MYGNLGLIVHLRLDTREQLVLHLHGRNKQLTTAKPYIQSAQVRFEGSRKQNQRHDFIYHTSTSSQ